jgi:hypothetical protein
MIREFIYSEINMEISFTRPQANRSSADSVPKLREMFPKKSSEINRVAVAMPGILIQLNFHQLRDFIETVVG